MALINRNLGLAGVFASALLLPGCEKWENNGGSWLRPPLEPVREALNTAASNASASGPKGPYETKPAQDTVVDDTARVWAPIAGWVVTRVR